MSATRRIDLPPYTRGWFAVASSSELDAGDLLPRHYFGRELVLLRSESGEARLIDAYCPHLGAHLGHGGRVEGDDVVCPFHGWRFGRDGACTGMPYGTRIPAAARTELFELREQNGVVLAWHDPEGGAPDFELPVFDDGHWTEPAWKTWTIRGHTQEVCENTADFGHFRFIHGTHVMRPLGEPRSDGPFFEVAFESDPEALVPELRLDQPETAGSGYCFGPGLTAADIVPKGSGLTAMQRLYVTPVDDERVELRGMVNVGRLSDEAATRAFAEGLTKAVFEQWERDVPIWEHKRYRRNPALNDSEAYLATFRRWYRQFYPARATGAD